MHYSTAARETKRDKQRKFKDYDAYEDHKDKKRSKKDYSEARRNKRGE